MLILYRKTKGKLENEVSRNSIKQKACKVEWSVVNKHTHTCIDTSAGL